MKNLRPHPYYVESLQHGLLNKRLAGLLLLLLGGVSWAAAQQTNQSRKSASLEEVAHFDHEVTGVAVAMDGRIFVNFPRWTEDTEISVAEVGPDGKLMPYPDAGWNAWRNNGNLSPETHLVCVQSVVADRHGNLWILDPGAPAIGTIVQGAPKLLQVDLATNQVKRVLHFGTDIAPQGSYLNDIRFTPDDRFAFLSDAGARGAMVVIDLGSGNARRVLDGVSATQAEPRLIVQVDGHPLRRTDGRAAVFNVDGITVSTAGDYVYWQALNGRTLYRVPTSALTLASLPEAALEAKIERVGSSEPTDGLWTDAQDRIFFTNFEANEIRRRDVDGTFHVVVQNPSLHWPDSMAEGPEGELYFTTSDIQDNAWFKAGASMQLSTSLWRVPGAMKPR